MNQKLSIKRSKEFRKLLNKERENLQLDLVICSFMPSTADLTIPIRDGINPKAIVYIRPQLACQEQVIIIALKYEKEHSDREGEFTFRNLEDGKSNQRRSIRIRSSVITQEQIKNCCSLVYSMAKQLDELARKFRLCI